MLQLALAFDGHLVQGMSPKAALEKIQKNPAEYPSLLRDALASITINKKRMRVTSVTVSELTTNMILDEDVTPPPAVTCARKDGILAQSRHTPVIDFAHVKSLLALYTNSWQGTVSSLLSERGAARPHELPQPHGLPGDLLLLAVLGAGWLRRGDDGGGGRNSGGC